MDGGAGTWASVSAAEAGLGVSSDRGGMGMNSPVLVALTRAGPSRENLRAVDEGGGLPAGVSAVSNQTQGEGGGGGGREKIPQ